VATAPGRPEGPHFPESSAPTEKHFRPALHFRQPALPEKPRASCDTAGKPGIWRLTLRQACSIPKNICGEALGPCSPCQYMSRNPQLDCTSRSLPGPRRPRDPQQLRAQSSRHALYLSVATTCIVRRSRNPTSGSRLRQCISPLSPFNPGSPRPSAFLLARKQREASGFSFPLNNRDFTCEMRIQKAPAAMKSMGSFSGPAFYNP
jgi:hypothetical protein